MEKGRFFKKETQIWTGKDKDQEWITKNGVEKVQDTQPECVVKIRWTVALHFKISQYNLSTKALFTADFCSSQGFAAALNDAGKNRTGGAAHNE